MQCKNNTFSTCNRFNSQGQTFNKPSQTCGMMDNTTPWPYVQTIRGELNSSGESLNTDRLSDSVQTPTQIIDMSMNEYS